jgi:accessory gene regulator protein AgrB
MEGACLLGMVTEVSLVLWQANPASTRIHRILGWDHWDEANVRPM